MDTWIGCPPVGLMVKRGGSKKLREPVGLPNGRGTFFFLYESGTAVPLLTKCPWRPSHASAGVLHTKSFSRQWSLEGAPHHRCGKCNTGPGGSRSLSVAHRWCSACSGIWCSSYQGIAVGPRQCFVVGVRPAKALRWGPGIALQRVFVLPRPCSGAQAVRCRGCSSYPGPAVGLGSELHRACFFGGGGGGIWVRSLLMLGAPPWQ